MLKLLTLLFDFIKAFDTVTCFIDVKAAVFLGVRERADVI